MKELLCIINPYAGNGSALRNWSKVARQLTQAGFRITEHMPDGPDQIAGIVRTALTGTAECLLSVGGDGTLGEIVNGYLKDDGTPINAAAGIALLPGGTGSDFARSIRINRLEDAVTALLKRTTAHLDVLRVTYSRNAYGSDSRFAINAVTLGMGGEVVKIVNGWRGRWPDWVGGRARFTLGALLAATRYRNTRVRITIDASRQIEAASNLVIAANGHFAGGGMMLAPNASMTDGLLDLILADGLTKLGLIRELARIRKGRHLENPNVKEEHARVIEISSESPLAVEIDGEVAGFTPARLEICPAAVRFVVPDDRTRYDATSRPSRR